MAFRNNISDSPIGVFDSGIGGLTVLRSLKKVLPHEDIIYFGDTARVPYGNKSKETITKFSTEITTFLIKRGVKIVIAACNTVSSLALDVLANLFKVPVVGVIKPGAAKAAVVSRGGRIGVIGTAATIRSGAYTEEIKRCRRNVTVFSQSCPLFVPFVEENWIDDEITYKLAERYLAPLKKRGIDTLVLGCTHYPLLKNVIRTAVGRGVELVDSADAAAAEVKALLAEYGLMNNSKGRGRNEFYVSDEPQRFAALGRRFLGSPIRAVRKVQQYV